MIKTTGLSYNYVTEDNVTNVLKDVNIEINEGEFVAVLGHNGSGKSTFAKLLNAILIPTEGTVVVDGIDTADEKTILEWFFRIPTIRLSQQWLKRMLHLRLKT